MNGNSFISWVLRSPLHGFLSDGMMLITFSGQKTGKKYTIPVGYFWKDGCLWILTSRNRTWWRNLQGGAVVDLLLKRKQVSGFAVTEHDEENVAELLVVYLAQIPQAARGLKVQVENGKPNTEDITRLAKERLFVRVGLAGRCKE